MASPFPFTKTKAPEAEVAAPAAATEAAPAATEAAPAAVKTKAAKGKKKSGEDRKAPAAEMTPDQVKQIISLVKEHSYTDIATMVGVTNYQVNRVLMNTKENLRKKAGDDAAKLAKVEQFIKDHLCRPEEARVGGVRGGKVKSAIDDTVDSILASL